VIFHRALVRRIAEINKNFHNGKIGCGVFFAKIFHELAAKSNDWRDGQMTRKSAWSDQSPAELSATSVLSMEGDQTTSRQWRIGLYWVEFCASCSTGAWPQLFTAG
jgi:hypothetical protein